MQTSMGELQLLLMIFLLYLKQQTLMPFFIINPFNIFPLILLNKIYIKFSNKMRTNKDSIERFKAKKVQNISKQSKYLQELLTASLPRYYHGNTEEMTPSSLIAAKRSYANDVGVKWVQNDEKPIIKLRKPIQRRVTSRSISPKKQDMRHKSPQKSIIKPQYNPQKEEDDFSKHPYSIIRRLQYEQRGKPQSEKVVYKYRDLNEMKVYNMQEVSSLIDELIRKQTDTSSGKLSVTDQFLLMNYIDLKIQKLIQTAKIQEKNQKKKPPPVYNHTSAKQEKDKKKQLLKLFEQIDQLWTLYQLKINHCPDMLKNNGSNTQIILQMKKLYRQILQLGEQIKKHQATCVHKKLNKFNPDPCYQNIVKKIKTVIKRFKQIITIKRQ